MHVDAFSEHRRQSYKVNAVDDLYRACEALLEGVKMWDIEKMPMGLLHAVNEATKALNKARGIE